jgi:MFS family permease
VQSVLGTGPLVAGFALATLTLGWPVTASQSGKVYMRAGFRTTALIGSAAAVLGTVLTALLSSHATAVEVGATCLVVGAGLGFVAGPTLIAAQATVGWSERGVVTGANMFGRSIGSAVGVAVFGAIANATLGTGSRHARGDLDRASHHVFLGVAVVAVLMAVAVLAMPATRPVAASAGEPTAEEATGEAASAERVPVGQ